MGKQEKAKSIKAAVVIADRAVQKTGELQLSAPLGVDIHSATGELTTPVELELMGDPLLTPQIVPGKLINRGLQKACLIVKRPLCDPCKYPISPTTKLDIPIQAVCQIAKILPGDDVQEFPVVEAISVRGFREPFASSYGKSITLVVKLVYSVRVIVTREKIVSLSEYCTTEDYAERSGFHSTGNPLYNRNNINIVVRPPKTN